ncbi:hypothetical protein, partial [Noviherbaspirillum galbum]
MKTIGRLVGSLTVARKLALIYMLDLTAVLFVSGILIREKYIAIDFAKKELVGSHYIAQVAGALAAVASAQMSRTQESAQGKAAV